MERKPDMIRAVVLIFAAGLVITGFTSLQASEDRQQAAARAAASEILVVSGTRD